MRRAGVIKLSLVCAAALAAAACFRVLPAHSEAALCSAQVDIASTRPGGANVDPDVLRVDAEIDATFAEALAQLKSAPPKDPAGRMELLGKLELYDKNLSVYKNQACTSCHVEDTGFTGGVDLYNRTIVAHPGSVPITNATGNEPNWRIAARRPQTYTYAPFSPVLHYNAGQEDFYGGNFWDMRATGMRLGNPAAAQAQGPFTNPVEMGLCDPACAVYRVSQGPYRELFEQVWGAQSFAVEWPSDIERICSTPGPPPPDDPFPVHLSPEDRWTANQTYDHMALAIAAYEAGPEVSPFSSKFDYAIAHPEEDVLSKEELAGWALFRGKGKCNTCHLDGTASGSGAVGPGDVADKAPLFTDFTAANLGVPRNPALPFYCENEPDQFGFTANPAGLDFVDLGVGGFLRGPLNPNPRWARLASEFDGKFQTPTLRNVDKRPRPDFVKAYAHNGYFKSLKGIVHFYNTRDKLPRCAHGSPGEKVTCWPGPEVSANVDNTVGNLGLSGHEEDQIVAFLKTLTDGYKPPDRRE